MDINNIIKKVLKEATSDGGGRGSYVTPLQLGIRPFKDSQNAPFTIPVSKYDSPMLEFDSYDGKMDETRKQIKKIEGKAKKITNYIKRHPESTVSDEDGGIINPTPGKNKKIVPIKESSTAVTAGLYNGPIEIGLKKWKKQHLGPFQEFVDTEFNHKKKQKTMKNNIKKTVGVWEKNPDGTYDSYEHDTHTISEDLAVWFGTKKKPKGSKQPKGPWVNICRKVDGKHPPCGRPEGGSKGYPKCRAVGVAAKMSDSQKRAACQQKRAAEKKDTQTGKGQKPIMTSYKPKNENMKPRIVNLTESDLRRIIDRVLLEQAPELTCDFIITSTNLIDRKDGELQIEDMGNGMWSFTKTSGVGGRTTTKKIRLEIPNGDEIQVAWDEKKQKIYLTGQKSLVAMESYNLLHDQNTTPEDCCVLIMGKQQPGRYFENTGPMVVSGTLSLGTDDIPFYKDLVERKDGAVITLYKSQYKHKKFLKKETYQSLVFSADESLENISPCQ